MIKSMTGFGCATGEVLGLRSRIEIKTLNNRYREFVIRLPHYLGAQEEPLKKLINAKVGRGRVDLWLQVDTHAAAPQAALDLSAARVVLGSLRALASELGLPGEVGLDQLLRLERLFSGQDGPNPLEGADPGAAWADLSDLAAAALDQLVAMRSAEGQALQADIETRLDALAQGHRDLKAIAASQPTALTKRYQARIEELAEAIVDPARLAQEAAILAERFDITEEITRFASHIKNFRSLLAMGEPVGRRLEFLLQELVREANTMGSKSQALQITEIVLAFKSELEKIREQVLNVE
jgi:uncharacterized protein (TIGR00255 family)